MPALDDETSVRVAVRVLISENYLTCTGQTAFTERADRKVSGMRASRWRSGRIG
jgi:hypothetical protein